MFKQGRPIEMFDWFSMIMIRKGSIKRLKDLLENININEDYAPEMHQRLIDLQFSSLLERVLTNDFHHFGQEPPQFNRLETLRKDGVWLEKHELLMKDAYQMNALDYMFQIERIQRQKKQEDEEDLSLTHSQTFKQKTKKANGEGDRNSSLYKRRSVIKRSNTLAEP